MEKFIRIYIPRWAGVLYVALAIILVPWIMILAEYLPNRHFTRHWDALWVGFDGILLITLMVTAYFVFKQTVWVVVSASALATLFLVDAWFDILTSRPGNDQRQAIAMGVLEVSLSLLTYRLVYHVLHQSTPEKNLRVIMKD